LDQDKNLRLIGLYLDKKLISKTILNALSISNNQQFCKILAEDIILYYNLEDIIVVNPNVISYADNTSLSNKVVEFVKKYSDQVEKLLKTGNFASLKLSTDLELYISSINYMTEKKLIICVKNYSTLLNANELSSLEDCINLMKLKLV
jgi:hypothetical protein